MRSTVLLVAVVLLVSAYAQNDDGFWEFVPEWKSTLTHLGPQTWNSACFQSNKGQLSLNKNGGTIAIDAEDRSSDFCDDWYVIATNQNVHIRAFLFSGNHQIDFTWKSQEEMVYVQQYGMQVFLVQGGAIGFLEDLFDTFTLFFGPRQMQDTIKFFHDYMNVTLAPRQHFFVNLSESDVMDGDYLAVLKVEGDHGGLNDMIMYGTGGRTGHAAAAMWIDGSLYVVESVAGEADNGVIKTPWNQWMQMAQQQSWMVALLRLSEESRAKFNSTAAIEWFKTVEGNPYGFHNFIFGWIDTTNDNFPPPISKQIMPLVFTIVEAVDPYWANSLWGEGLNKRMGTTGLTTLELFELMEQKNVSFYDVLTIPEQDHWIYSDGPSMTCDVFVTKLYRHAGVLAGLEFEATELVPLDSYSLNIYESNWNRPAPCLVDNLPYCQLVGNYVLDLGEAFNKIAPYQNMFQHCGGLPPKYIRQPGC